MIIIIMIVIIAMIIVATVEVTARDLLAGLMPKLRDAVYIVYRSHSIS